MRWTRRARNGIGRTRRREACIFWVRCEQTTEVEEFFCRAQQRAREAEAAARWKKIGLVIFQMGGVSAGEPPWPVPGPVDGAYPLGVMHLLTAGKMQTRQSDTMASF